jgi:small subunit ribosomal protein S1
MVTTKKATNSPIGQLLKNGATPQLLKENELIEATFIYKEQKAAYFDLGPCGTGIVYGVQYSSASDAIKKLSIGDKISAKITELENEDGYVELSLTEAGLQKSYEEVQELREKGEILSTKITGANSGGLLTDVQGLKAFLPVSQLSPEHYPRVDDGDKAKILEELKKFVGESLDVKIIDFKPRAKKLIVSEREIVQENTKELLGAYTPGDVVDGIISGVATFGAFMKFANTPQIEGLIHISELDHRLIENPKEIVSIGDAVKAKILEIKDGRVSLSLKALKADPWATVEERYKVGGEYEGTVSRFNPFGAFIALDKDIQGLIHVSEFGSIEEMKAKIEVGKKYTFRVESAKGAEKRIILKLKK